jgi:addiction module RelE/StbE family toxin
MAFQVIWSEPAIEDLRSITEYIAADNPDAAERTGLQILAQTRWLMTHPLFGRMLPERGDRRIREVILRPYRIVYRVDEPKLKIEILRVWHGARGTPDV